MRRFFALALVLLAGPALAGSAITLAEDAALRSVPLRLTIAQQADCFHVDARGGVMKEPCRFVASGDSATPGSIDFSDPIAQCHNFRWSDGLLVCADEHTATLPAYGGPVDLLPRWYGTWTDRFPELHKPDDQSQDCTDQLWDVVRTSIDVLSGRRLSIKGALARAAE